MEHKGYRFVDPATATITISRDARFVELGNGTSSVDFPVHIDQDESGETELQPLEKEFNDGETDDDTNDLYFDAPEDETARGDDVRRSKRANKGVNPQHLEDYVVGIAACAVQEPLSYRDTVKSKEWRDAMEEELGSHKRNGTWELVPLPEGRKVSSTAEQCLYVKEENGNKVFLLVYVDDMLLAASTVLEVKKIINNLCKEFELTDLGEVRHFLGLEVLHEEECYKIRLKSYIEQLIVKNGMGEAKVSRSPMDAGFLKVEVKCEKLNDPTKYRSLVGGLLYVSVIARPDIAVSTSILGRRFSDPNEADWTAAKRVLRYLKATKDYCLRLGGLTDEGLVGYSDADWAGDPASRRSTLGAAFYYHGGLISWASRRQQCVTLSSMEAEYVALSEACQETIWLRQLLFDFGEPLEAPAILKEDNQGCLAFVKTERTNRRSKHISTKEKFI
ncbi:uncharacterized protein LOC134206332 [Armigeres subalbatus]|uniref:uncharacterized protein LOC134206332 n=1 Tax=Armigeres subalbatus TaxID=124917 RepID=UPI002ED55FEA